MQANATSAYNVTLSLFRRRLQKAREIDKGYSELAPIAKINPHVVIVKMNTRCLCFNYQSIHSSTSQFHPYEKRPHPAIRAIPVPTVYTIPLPLAMRSAIS